MSRIATATEPRVSSTECPVSFVTPQSAAWFELFVARETLGEVGDLLNRSAREVDAMATLQQERRKREVAISGE